MENNEDTRPDSILVDGGKGTVGYLVRSSKARTFIAEVMFVSTGPTTGTWWVDEWLPGRTLKLKTGKEMEEGEGF